MTGEFGSAPKLRLRIRNVTSLDNGVPTEIELDQRGLIIGRSATADWSLPDPRSYISSRHCEIAYRQGAYQLIDLSTNGTHLNGSTERLQAPRDLADGDVITIGHYEVLATLSGASAGLGLGLDQPPPASGGWKGWGPEPSAPAADPGGWGSPAPMPAISGQGAMSGNWSPPEASTPASGGWGAEPAADPGWGVPAPAPSPAASGWSSPVPDHAPAPSTNDVWGQLAETNVVDWARGGFGAAPPPPPVEAPLALGRSTPAFEAPPPAPLSQIPGAPAIASTGGNGMSQLLIAAGLGAQDVKQPDPDALAAAGGLLRRLVAGLVVMLEARARAKAQLGAQSTSLEFDGNNPIKFARTPEQALSQLLNPPERGFMSAERAIEDAFLDLQAHQVATLKAMQGALKGTLDRFSPTAIRKRAEAGGFLQRILPGAKDAALWQAYEREFGGVAQGSDEAFMDVFAKEFKRAYEDQAKRAKR